MWVSRWLVAVAAAALVPGQMMADAAKPNVLLIVVDDLKPLLGAYGARTVSTPNIDALLNKGVRFENAHAQRSECCPSRSAFFSGKRPDASGMHAMSGNFYAQNPNSLTLPGLLRANGYRAEAVGKLLDDRAFPGTIGDTCRTTNASHCSWDDLDAVWANQVFCEDGTVCKNWPSADPALNQNDRDLFLVFRHDDTFSKHNCDRCITSQAVRKLQTLARANNPFILGVGYMKPHMPWTGPASLFEKYDKIPPSLIQTPAEFSNGVGKPFTSTVWTKASKSQAQESMYGNKASSGSAPDKNYELRHYKDAGAYDADERIRGYYATLEFVDTQIGVLMNEFYKLESSVVQNTIIVLWGDHGFYLGNTGLWGKKGVLEHATRTPLGIVPHSAWIASQSMQVRAMYAAGGLSAEMPVDSVDVYPTLCELANIKPPSDISGVSLVPILQDPSRHVRAASVSQYESYLKIRIKGAKVMAYAFRTKFYRFVVHLRWSPTSFIQSLTPIKVELYRYLNFGDYETRNLAYLAEFRETVQQLRALFFGNGLSRIDRDFSYLNGIAPFDKHLDRL